MNRDKARLLLASGVDPAQRRQLDKLERQAQQQITFEAALFTSKAMPFATEPSAEEAGDEPTRLKHIQNT